MVEGTKVCPDGQVLKGINEEPSHYVGILQRWLPDKRYQELDFDNNQKILKECRQNEPGWNLLYFYYECLFQELMDIKTKIMTSIDYKRMVAISNRNKPENIKPTKVQQYCQQIDNTFLKQDIDAYIDNPKVSNLDSNINSTVDLKQQRKATKINSNDILKNIQLIAKTEIQIDFNFHKILFNKDETMLYFYYPQFGAYNLQEKRVEFRKEELGSVMSISLSKDNQQLLAHNNVKIFLINALNGDIISEFEITGYPAFGFITETLFFTHNNPQISILELNNNEITIKEHFQQYILSLIQSQIDPSKCLILTADRSMIIELNLITFEIKELIKFTDEAMKKTILSFYFSDDEKKLFFVGQSYIDVYTEDKEGEWIFKCSLNIPGVATELISADESLLFINGKYLTFWNLDTLSLISTYELPFSYSNMIMSSDKSALYITKDNQVLKLQYQKQIYNEEWNLYKEQFGNHQISKNQDYQYGEYCQRFIEYSFKDKTIKYIGEDERMNYGRNCYILNTPNLILAYGGQDEQICLYDLNQDYKNPVAKQEVKYGQNISSQVFLSRTNQDILYVLINDEVIKVQVMDEYIIKQDVLFKFNQYFDEGSEGSYLLLTENDEKMFLSSTTGIYQIDLKNQQCEKIVPMPYTKIFLGQDNDTIIGYLYPKSVDRISVSKKAIIKSYKFEHMQSVWQPEIGKVDFTSSDWCQILNIENDCVEMAIKKTNWKRLIAVDKQNLIIPEQNGEKAFYLNNDYSDENLHRLGINGLKKLIPFARIVYDPYQNNCEFFDHNDELLINFFTKEYNWASVVPLQELLIADTQKQLKLVSANLDSSCFLPWPKYQMNIFHAFALKPKLLQAIIDKLNDNEELQKNLLFFEDRYEKSPLDYAIENNQLVSIQILVDAMIKFSNNPLYNYMIDKNLLKLIEFNINLDEYFNSKLPCCDLTWDTYPDQHHDNSNLVKPSNAQQLRSLRQAHDELFDNDLRKITEDDVLYPVQYHVINLPYTITENPKEFSKAMNECQTIKIFEEKVIQTIIDYKWDTYTKSFFLKQFYMFCVFILSFVLDIYVIEIQGDQQQPFSLAFKSICAFILIYFLTYELSQARKEGILNYLASIWNYIDLLLSISYVTVSAVQIISTTQENADTNVRVYVRLTYSLIIVLMFIKFCFFMRIFQGFGFLATMLKEVITDLKYFIAFFGIVVFTFAMIFMVLQQDLHTYKGLGQFGYFFMSFRTALGDFELDNYANVQEISIQWAMWIFWAAAVFISSIIFLNFIIAVISESYEKVMQKAIAKSYQGKIAMILERESQFTDEDLKNSLFFPRYIVVRSTFEGRQEDEEWQGLVKDFKNSLHETNKQIKQNLTQVSKKVNSSVNSVKDSVKEVKEDLQIIKTSFQTELQGVKKNIDDVQKTQLDMQKYMMKLLTKFDLLDYPLTEEQTEEIKTQTH